MRITETFRECRYLDGVNLTQLKVNNKINACKIHYINK